MVSAVRRPIIAGNWKMNTTLTEAADLATQVRGAVASHAGYRTEVVLCPPFLSLAAVAAAVEDAPIGVGAQTLAGCEGASTCCGRIVACCCSGAG